MSLDLRKKRIQYLVDNWSMEKRHDLMARFKIPEILNKEFLMAVKLYISKALNFTYVENEEEFIKLVDNNRENRKNITPNGAVVPKREFQLEYNLVMRNWGAIVRSFIRDKTDKLLIRTTPNIRIKFGAELEDNIKRDLNTSKPHSDAWVEGAWGMNCYLPLLGDVKNNTLKFYEPINFKEEYLAHASTYDKMSWVLDHYKEIDYIPDPGYVYLSDYALIHNTERKNNCGTRISIDTTIWQGDHQPLDDRKKEYQNTIPNIGVEEYIDAGQYEDQKFAEKLSVYSHYTSATMKRIKL